MTEKGGSTIPLAQPLNPPMITLFSQQIFPEICQKFLFEQKLC